ncbi:tRNA (guanine-N(7)-)-methyltransferase [Alteracholeplasma palmae J233]|uniref:tRNA (guanine-N(7)-)-methyltransferase n=1 Tax=Alteracholeplasma palmae (strain ATCC 49389 / J233) TaxID=1318466 RepID=U4KKF6_ALTPJ|nr:tRNA (guanosine(46)-N7)-methyltransferase TrmB [Alteracholeplasma palmae]CCV64082.1 tRNA (guanine-N(7)-)-methyltransferase [Alteracholeplasma palmae J233]
MRQKKIKGIDSLYLEKKGVITKVTPLVFPEGNKIFVEIGSGKGDFITSLAKDHPNDSFVAIEKIDSVCYRIWQKKDELKLENLTIILDDAIYLEEYFKSYKVDQIYLNFSDPWPKARHHKRRLTYSTFLTKYKNVLKKEGELQLRTDHLELFNDSLEYIEKVFDITKEDRNLAVSKYMTEYEVKKRKTGPIYQLNAKVQS